MEFPPGIETGDGGAMDMKLSNKVYNKIRNFSVKEGKRKSRLHDKKEQSTAEMALDPQTRVLLQKMINNGVLESVRIPFAFLHLDHVGFNVSLTY